MLRKENADDMVAVVKGLATSIEVVSSRCIVFNYLGREWAMYHRWTTGLFAVWYENKRLFQGDPLTVLAWLEEQSK